MDPTNKEKAFSDESINYWKQVDLYVGGASHAVMHLLYARFWHKALYDLGIVKTKEPFKKLFNQGMVTAYAFKDSSSRLVASDDVVQKGQSYFHIKTNEPVEKFISKMAKSLKNVVNPDDVIAQSGCDVLRIYLMFMGPLDDEKPWSSESISGCEKFIRRVWDLFVDENSKLSSAKVCASEPSEKSEYFLHKCLKRVDDSFKNFNFNIAIAAMMEFVNDIQSNQISLTKTQSEFFLKMLSPFAPHIASELWEMLGNKNQISFASWPKLDESQLVLSSFELVLQVNGKIRKKMQAAVGLDKEQLSDLAKTELNDFIVGSTIVKIIAVPNKLVNIVVKS
jgi:leucyl-tRNA synthetase